MEQLLSGNTEQLQWSIMESESTYGSSPGRTYMLLSEHVQLPHRSTCIEQLLLWRTQSSSAAARETVPLWQLCYGLGL